MNLLRLIWLPLLAFNWSQAQGFFYNGVVKDEQHKPLANVSILHISSGIIFQANSYGAFQFKLENPLDTLLFYKEGFISQKLILKTAEYATVSLKPKSPGDIASAQRDRLFSLTRNLQKEDQRSWIVGNESYAAVVENRFVNAQLYPSTGIALNVDKASYSNLRRFLLQNQKVPIGAVRLEEMLNYFNLDFHRPNEEEVFGMHSALMDCPWDKSSKLFYVNLSSKPLDVEELPPSHLTFLIDVSGSMDLPNRLPLLKSAFRLLTNSLRDRDTVSIVVYGAYTGVILNGVGGAHKDSILNVIDALEPGGATPGESGIGLAYRIAKQHFIPGGNNRVILATDGDFNVGLKTEEELDNLISQHRQTGIYLTCLGVGMGNYKDSKIQTLARKGNGNFAYLDGYVEAEKVLLKEFTQTMYTVADNVYLNVDFNKELISEYRLIGFDNRAGAIRDSLAVIEGGEIGPMQSLTAVFEVKLNKALLDSQQVLCNIRMQYNLPNDTVQYMRKFQLKWGDCIGEENKKVYEFYNSLIHFGSYLKESAFVGKPDWDKLLERAKLAIDPTQLLQQEFISLILKAKDIYTAKKKKKAKKKK